MMKRGDIHFANLDPTIGSEIKKKRPVVIISNNANNRVSDTITVVPLTSNLEKVHQFEVALSQGETHLKKDSKAKAQQIRTISKKRLSRPRSGCVSKEKMAQLDVAIKLHLALY